MSHAESIESSAASEQPGLFGHTEHVRLAWLYLREFTFVETLLKVSEALRMFATVNNAPQLYNETLTWAFITIINERMHRLPSDHQWDDFRNANPDLFDWKRNILKSYYRDETLQSDLAKGVFILPDRCSQCDN